MRLPAAGFGHAIDVQKGRISILLEDPSTSTDSVYVLSRVTYW